MKKLYNPLVLFIVFGLIAYLVYVKVKPNDKDSIIITDEINTAF